MQQPNNTPKKSPNLGITPKPTRVNYDTLRQMSKLSYKSTRPLGDTVPTGTPGKYVGIVRYANLRRQSFKNTNAKRTLAGIQDILAKIAEIRGKAEEPTQSALFWCVRAWFLNRSAPLSSVDLEYNDQLSIGSEVHQRNSPTKIVFASMAAWACRHASPQPEFMPLCLQIRNKIQHGEYDKLPRKGVETEQGFTRQFSFPTNKTTAWCQWVGYACGEIIPLPATRLGTFEQHRDRWQKMGLGSHHVEILEKFDEKIFDEFRRPIHAGSDRDFAWKNLTRAIRDRQTRPGERHPKQTQ